MTTSFGVPQGSILGSMLFNLYVNDLQNHFQSNSVQYADETTIYEDCKPKKIKNEQHIRNESLMRVNDWSHSNSIAATAVKTKYTLCASKRLYDYHQLKEKDIGISVGSTKLKLDKEPRYLGIYLDQHLTWENPIKHIIDNCYSKLSVL